MIGINRKDIQAILKAGAKKSQKISTHLLTVLITSAILQLEQRKRIKREKRNESSMNSPPPEFQETR